MADTLEMNPYGMLLIGTGIQVEIGFFAAKNSNGSADALVKLTGRPAFDAGLDGKVIRCSGLSEGNQQALTWSKGGKTLTLLRGSDAWKRAELYLGNEKLVLKVDKDQLETARPLHLQTEYSQRFDNVPARLEIERSLKTLEGELKDWKVSMTIGWNGLNEKVEARQTLDALIKSLSVVFKSLLADAMGREALKTINSLKIEVDTTAALNITKKQTQLEIQLGMNVDALDSTKTLTSLIERVL